MSQGVRYLAATLALAAIALGYVLIHREPVRPGSQLVHQPAEARQVLRPLPATARAILGWGAELSLTKDQKVRLEALDRRWQAEAASVEADIQREEAAFGRFMQEAQAGGKTNLQEIQRQSADLRGLSEALRKRRQRHADAALEILTDSQRQMLSKSAASARHGGA